MSKEERREDCRVRQDGQGEHREANWNEDIEDEKAEIEKAFADGGWKVYNGRQKKRRDARKGKRHLNPLITIEPGGMHRIRTSGECEDVKFAVDSGAAETGQ